MSRGGHRGLGAAAIAAAAIGATGCSGFDYLEFKYESAPLGGATIKYSAIQIHEGIAVGVTATPMEDDEAMDDDTRVDLESDDPAVIGVAPRALEDADSDDHPSWRFVIFGVSPGTASVRVRIDGDTEDSIPATVEAQ